MRTDCDYEVVLEMDYPMGNSSDLAYDTWGRDVTAKLRHRFPDDRLRVVRSHGHLKVCLYVPSLYRLNADLPFMLTTVMPQAPESVKVTVTEVEKVEGDTLSGIPFEEFV